MHTGFLKPVLFNGFTLYTAYMKKHSFIAGAIVAVALTVPFAASALSIDAVQQQIKDLMSRVSALQSQLAGSSSTSSAVLAVPAKGSPRLCGIMQRSLSIGRSGDDVKGLQEFLREEGYLNTQATGYFGNATQVALRKWQFENGVIAKLTAGGSGTFGPATMARFKARCGSDLLTVTPAQGAAPLTVTVMSGTGDEQDYRPSMADGQDTLIDFGDGSERVWVHCAVRTEESSVARCVTPVSMQHTYEKDGVYVVSIVRAGGMCIGGCPETILASQKVSVGGPIACTREYMPVCGAKPVVCITTPCNPVPTSYGNLCTMKADGATLLYSGECKDTSLSPEANPQCKAWFDGCNSCGRSEPGGPAFCTLKYCAADATQKASCTAYFDGGSTGNKPPVISSFSGPVQLSVNEIGTWKITASDPENGELQYSILWGDEWVAATDASRRVMAPAQSIQQQTTFTHSFSRAGTFTVGLTVTDKEGAQARSTATVQVAQTACTADYAPVCGRPQGCVNTCPVGMYCAAVCQLHQAQTYSSRCQMNNANADFVHDGVCNGTE